MSPVEAAVLGVLTAACGFAALRLAMVKHGRQLLGHPPGRALAVILRGFGAAALAAALLICLSAWTWRIGLVAWFGVLSAGALITIFAFALTAPGRKAHGRRPAETSAD